MELAERDLSKSLRETGVNSGFSLWGGVTTLPSSEKSTNPSLQLQWWLTGLNAAEVKDATMQGLPAAALFLSAGLQS